MSLHRKWTSRFFRRAYSLRNVGRRAPQPRRHLLRGSFAPLISTDWCCDWFDDLRHKNHILHDYPCFYALQETDSWTTSAMNILGLIVYGVDHGRTAILCPREVNQFRRSWVDNERCTAILVGSMMLLFCVFFTAQWTRRGGLHRGPGVGESCSRGREKEWESWIFSSAAT